MQNNFLKLLCLKLKIFEWREGLSKSCVGLVWNIITAADST